MKTWGTTIYAICPLTGEMRTYGGPNIEAPTRKLAFEYCQNNGLGYCHIEGELVAEIPCKPGTHEADFSKMVDYENRGNN